jgi:hypothetical protein
VPDFSVLPPTFTVGAGFRALPVYACAFTVTVALEREALLILNVAVASPQ